MIVIMAIVSAIVAAVIFITNLARTKRDESAYQQLSLREAGKSDISRWTTLEKSGLQPLVLGFFVFLG